MRTSSALLLLLSTASVACANGRLGNEDAGRDAFASDVRFADLDAPTPDTWIGTFDAPGLDASVDAHALPDVPQPDAYVPPGVDAPLPDAWSPDAFTPPPDAWDDARAASVSNAHSDAHEGFAAGFLAEPR